MAGLLGASLEVQSIMVRSPWITMQPVAEFLLHERGALQQKLRHRTGDLQSRRLSFRSDDLSRSVMSW